MTPVFDPGPNPHGLPPIFCAGVGPRMTEVAGEVADGFFVHPFHTRRSVEECTLPALERGRARAGRGTEGFGISCQLILATGRSDDALLETIAVVGPRDEIADRVRDRCAGFADRVSLVAPFAPDAEVWSDVVQALRA